MKAALLHRIGDPMLVAEADIPTPGDGELLLKVEACGVCHSDIHLAAGEWPDAAARMRFPAILGHEAVGRVVTMGEGATGFAIGDRAGVGWLCSVCGACEPCREGAENVCLSRAVTGIEMPGGYAAFMRVKASMAIPIPAGLAPAEAAPLFCAGLTVFHASRLAKVGGGRRVGIFGVGGLGHLAIQVARASGAEVWAFDAIPGKLDLARSLGASETIDVRDAGAVARAERDGGLHAALVTAPSAVAYRMAVRMLRRRGTLAVVGLPKEDLTFFADDLVVGEIHIVGSAVGTRAETRELLALAASGKIRCEVEEHPLEAVSEVFGRLRRGEILGRAVLVMR